MTADNQDRTIWTVGHSNRDAAVFVELLASHSIALIADVRRFPGSRRLPHFGREQLEATLGDAAITYRHFPELGGRRKERLPDSRNTAWRVASFNAYADYMRTAEFQSALEELENAASQQRTAVMCAEALPWRCHRRLIADALIVRDWQVLDILAPSRADKRRLTDFARVEDGHVTYPSEMLF
ncbi:MAG: DUF488 domain-containing protein [Planctomycetes bacterium]|nr:DUF488 domain-containing protein [Planctomycetota bacterium]